MAPLLFSGRNREKSISIPDKNINTITPTDDKRLRLVVVLTTCKPLLPKITPTMISATAVGTPVI